ncbi:glycosyltransferase [Microvirga thermotolerans]|uniref:Glycosyltransferase n=1 Tax=Microvirga thermotolerans TaxID=2651334 RepID=A0A5P9K3E1_9HYPH|nr:glycosyltransferase [Microvirga thermotolerans]QFU18215.1 glycosyltransferase [Microvirga thermotolerans]
MEAALKSAYRKAAATVERIRRRRIVFSFRDEDASEPTVYFLVPDYNRPSGGVRTLYRHVDILNAAGLHAVVLHRRRNFRCTWFEHRAPVRNVQQVTICRNDLLVLTELDIDILDRLPRGLKHAIFNQGIHLTWTRATGTELYHYTENPDLVGVVTVSDHSLHVMRHAFNPPRLRRIRLSIDPCIYYWTDASRAKRISYMPRRGERDIPPVLGILRARRVLDDWQILPIDGMAPAEVGDALRTSRIFLSFSEQEGFGLPAAEAMACGNYVIGYHGFGGGEFFRPEFSMPVPSADVLAFASEVERAVNRDREDGGWCQRRGREASAFILSEYSPERERGDVIGTYTEFLQGGTEGSAEVGSNVRYVLGRAV